MGEDSLTQEFAACGKQMIEFVNTGRINTRIKGPKKAALQEIMVTLRKKTVQLVKSQRVAAKEAYPF